MATPPEKPLRTSPRGQPNNPIYARTSVLCNGQIVWKVAGNQDMEKSETDLQRADLKSISDVTDDLNALNGLQIHRAKLLTPLEVKQPLRHVQSSLPKAVKSGIYTGDLYGSAEGVFSCSSEEFEKKLKSVFENERRVSGAMNYNDFFRRLRRSEWLLWDVEAEKGHWVAVIAHLYKKPIRNPNKKKFPGDSSIPATIPSTDFNRIDEWCVVTAERSSKGDAMVKRVKHRLLAILKEGRIGFDSGSEIRSGIWVPMDQSKWGSGIHVYNLIKTLMHRITEFHCREVPYDKSLWSPLPGWLNIDEVRAEMQGRAAQRCMAATGYRSRIAIEGVRRWIGAREVVRANELRPRQADSIAYHPGLIGQNGRCVPVGSSTSGSGDSPFEDDDNDYDNGNDNYNIDEEEDKNDDEIYNDNDDYDNEYDIHGGPIGTPPSHVYGWDPSQDSEDDIPPVMQLPLSKMRLLKELGITITKSRVPKDGEKGPPGEVISVSTMSSKPVQYVVQHIVQHNPPAKSPAPANGKKAGDSKKRKADEAHIDIVTDIQGAGGLNALLKKRLKELGGKGPKAFRVKKGLSGIAPIGQEVF
ncbi:hypothetical protein F5Y12DRAFT_712796 [Xylaria sp. FL1777]|nr:hypothetical protein F5Y12DRAFT_712796 [Xylaria sp. FL1777]